MRHLWQSIKGESEQYNKIRCQICEEVMTFSCQEFAASYVEADKSEYCQGIPGPKAHIAHGFDKYPVRAPVVSPIDLSDDNSDYY